MCANYFVTFSNCAIGFLATILSTAKRLHLFVLVGNCEELHNSYSR